MKFFTQLPYSFGELLLYKHMYIFAFGINFESTRFKVFQYAVKPVYNAVCLVFGYYSAACKHRCVRHTALYILLIHSAVKSYRRVKVIGNAVYRTAGSACPHFHKFSSLGLKEGIGISLKRFLLCILSILFFVSISSISPVRMYLSSTA